MNADLERLIVLQAEDLELKRLRSELAALPGRIHKATLARNEAAAKLTGLEEALRHEDVLRRRQGSDADDHRTKLARLRRQLAEATSAAQITALDHEIGFSETAIRRLEDEELESMGRSDDLESARAASEASLARCSAALAHEQSYAADRKQHHEAAIATEETERRTLRGSIGDALLATYDRVSKVRGTGVAEASDGQCTACRMKVRPQRWNDLIGRDHEDELFTCETCGRLLFYDPRRNTPGPWAAGERLSAALAPAVAASEARA